MNLLALDTSTDFCSAAVCKQGQWFADHIRAGAMHSELILPMIDELLAKARLTLTELDVLAFGSGPGSFTGLRIACGVAQGLAYGSNRPVIGIPTLLAMAEQSQRPQVITALDARMGEVYLAAYRRDTVDWQCELEPGVYRPAVTPMLSGTGWYAIGPGWAAYPNLLNRYAEQVVECDPQLVPTALAVGQLALRRFASGQTTAAHEAAPLYVRHKVALTLAEQKDAAKK